MSYTTKSLIIAHSTQFMLQVEFVIVQQMNSADSASCSGAVNNGACYRMYLGIHSVVRDIVLSLLLHSNIIYFPLRRRRRMHLEEIRRNIERTHPTIMRRRISNCHD